jgi:DNA-binding GntR family transcriptional regulator
VYHAILKAIREGVYQAGDPLREIEVAQRLGVSRTPVREALSRLQDKGLVEPAPGRGLAVARLSNQQIFELYSLRADLEKLVVRNAVQYATSFEIDNFERLNEMFGNAKDIKSATEANSLLHASLREAARNRFLHMAIDDLQDTVALISVTVFSAPGRIDAAYKEHAAIIAAIRDRDSERAEALMGQHIEALLETRMSLSRLNALETT